MSKFIWCILGRSGSGKDTLLDILLSEYFPGRTKLVSKTTRAPRFDGESCHVFTDSAELEKDIRAGRVVAYNNYACNHYWATEDQVDNADFYIVDVPGLKQLRKEYEGDKVIKAIGLQVSSSTSLNRMLKRGDSEEKAAARLDVDDEAFADIQKVTDMCLACDSFAPHDVAKIVAEYIKTTESVN